jgi:16S rRNA (guanine527-N7)-methyltransferase
MIPISDLPGVSRETVERLRSLHALLIKWNPAINLVSRTTVQTAWDRHIVDSTQIYQLGHTDGHWADLGSGGGFPGLVIACMALGGGDPIRVTLVESDQRKATFLRTASAQLGLETNVISQRIEQVPPLQARTLSARALAPLGVLLGYAARHLSPQGLCLFPKGATWRQEVELARKDWHFDLDVHQSTTDSDGAILSVKAISHV